jgi:hypothetical protein
VIGEGVLPEFSDRASRFTVSVIDEGLAVRNIRVTRISVGRVAAEALCYSSNMIVFNVRSAMAGYYRWHNCFTPCVRIFNCSVLSLSVQPLVINWQPG